MNEWWNRLSSREKWMILIGGIVAIIILGEMFLWSPLSSSVSQLQVEVVKQHQLLKWMGRAGQRIQQLRAAGFTQAPPTDQAILVLTERTLAEQKLSQYLNQVQQPSNTQLILTFKVVPFDALIKWLQLLWIKYGINVNQIDVKKTDTVGLVQVKLTLEK